MKTPPDSREAERRLKWRDAAAHLATDAIDASVGAAAGGAVGALAGPVGLLAGAAMGALAGGVLGHQADEQQHEAALHDRELDAIDAEEEFFGQALPLLADRADEEPFAALESLRAEHRRIQSALDRLDVWGEIVEGQAAVDGRAEALRLTTFLRAFAEDRHARKEGQILFAAIDQACSSRERGPLAMMLREHLMLDGLCRDLHTLASSIRPWTQAERARAIECATTYADLYRRHIRKEEEVVYRMADERLPPETKREVDVAFTAFEARRGEDERWQ